MGKDFLDLGGRVALITGAGQGIGRQIALHFAGQNCGGVAVNDYVLERAESVAEEIRAAGANAFPIQGDVTDFENVQSMVQQINSELGPIGILINNAGNSGATPIDPDMSGKPFWEIGPAGWA